MPPDGVITLKARTGTFDLALLQKSLKVEIKVGEGEYEAVDVLVEVSPCEKPSDYLDDVYGPTFYEYDEDDNADDDTEVDEVSCAEVSISGSLQAGKQYRLSLPAGSKYGKYSGALKTI